MKRLGRKGHPTYRVVVQDSRQSPSSGKYVALLGSYDPHTKDSTLVKDKAEFYLKNGAQPSDRVVALFKSEKITMPKWLNPHSKKEKSIKNPDKLRKNRSKEAPAETPAEVQPESAEQTEGEAKEPEVEATADAKNKPEEKFKEEEQASGEETSEPAAEASAEEPKSEDKA